MSGIQMAFTFLQQLEKLIASNGLVHPLKTNRKGSKGWQLDPKKRRRIEESAMKTVIRQYESWGYDIRPVPDEHLGWDIQVERDGVKLFLEVKGVSGKEVSAELTPNEYFHLKKHRS